VSEVGHKGCDMNKKTVLDIPKLIDEAKRFSEQESSHWEPSLFGVTDGKAVGTYLEKKFQEYLSQSYDFTEGNAAKGIDFPKLGVDIKVTSQKQPQSSCPFRNARQKIYGLGYSLLVFVYQKFDNTVNQVSRLDITHSIFVESERTADYQLISRLLSIIKNNGNQDDIQAIFLEALLPVDDITANTLAEEILKNPPKQGYLTISNALQWRLQYTRIISVADTIEGIIRIK
jgi:hypothetical protein